MAIDFNLSTKDLASVEVQLNILQKKSQAITEQTLETIGKMNIEMDSIKVPSLKMVGKIQEYNDNFQINVVQDLIEVIQEKKRSILKTDEDHTAYAEMMAEAEKVADQDLKAKTRSAKPVTM